MKITYFTTNGEQHEIEISEHIRSLHIKHDGFSMNADIPILERLRRIAEDHKRSFHKKEITFRGSLDSLIFI